MMYPYALLISRLVPLLLILSVCLIIAKALRDRMAPSNVSAARAVFAIIVAASASYAVFDILQTSLAVAAVRATTRQDWQGVDVWYRRYVRLRGNVTPVMAAGWSNALMHLHRWSDAGRMLLRTGAPSPRGMVLSPDAVLNIGETFFYAGDLLHAEPAFKSVRRTAKPYVRDYFLGRIAARRGQGQPALALYAASLNAEPRFFPAFYHRERLLIAARQFDPARDAARVFVIGVPSVHSNPLWKTMLDAIATGRTPPDVEFYVLES